jgi:hypothetical protein
MSFKTLTESLKNMTNEERKEFMKKAAEKAAVGFHERQAERESRFAAEAKSREPSAAWYERSYDL